MKYYDVVKNWRKIKPHLDNPELNTILVEDFNKFTFGRWRKEFKPGMYPRDFESCDWDLGRKGRKPEYWKYVKHAACHWLVNWNLQLAMLVAPDREWHILTSDQHSTVWDGKETLFDCNYLALQVDPDEAFESAKGEALPIECFMETHFALHYSVDNARFRDLRSKISEAELSAALASESAILNALTNGSDELKELVRLISNQPPTQKISF